VRYSSGEQLLAACGFTTEILRSLELTIFAFGQHGFWSKRETAQSLLLALIFRAKERLLTAILCLKTQSASKG